MDNLSPIDSDLDLVTKKYVELNAGGGGGGITVSETAPSSPSSGDLWFDSSSGELFVYYDGFWVAPSLVASVPTAAAGTIQPNDSAAEGTSTSFSRADHSHNISTAAAATITGTNAEGSSTSFARADHNHSFGTESIATAALENGAVTAAKLNADTFGKAQTLNAQTGAYTLVSSDVGKVVTVNTSSNVNITVNTTTGLAAGQRIDLLTIGTGTITIAASGVTVNATPGAKLRARYSGASLLCIGTNDYVLIGDLAA